MQSHLEEKATFLQTKGGLNLQPHVVVTCDDLEKLHRPNGCIVYAVIQNDVFFEFHSLLGAVEICLKSLFAIYSFQPPHICLGFFCKKQYFKLHLSLIVFAEKLTQLLQDTY